MKNSAECTIIICITADLVKDCAKTHGSLFGALSDCPAEKDSAVFALPARFRLFSGLWCASSVLPDCCPAQHLPAGLSPRRSLRSAGQREKDWEDYGVFHTASERRKRSLNAPAGPEEKRLPPGMSGLWGQRAIGGKSAAICPEGRMPRRILRLSSREAGCRTCRQRALRTEGFICRAAA